MIVFVDIPVIGRNACGFFDTVFETFVSVDGCHAFDSMREVMEIEPRELAERCAALVPPGFFDLDNEVLESLRSDYNNSLVKAGPTPSPPVDGG